MLFSFTTANAISLKQNMIPGDSMSYRMYLKPVTEQCVNLLLDALSVVYYSLCKQVIVNKEIMFPQQFLVVHMTLCHCGEG